MAQALNSIHQLYFYHLVNEAIDAQRRFNELWEAKDLTSMKDLVDEVKALLKAARKAESTDEV
ncbi:hypothetical protein D3C81_1704730 [compost metagenome]